MRLSGFWACLLVLAVLFSCQAKVGFAQNETGDYITWNDFKMDHHHNHHHHHHHHRHHHSCTNKDLSNPRKVVVVDKDGFGDSITVQGAVDMVPENNAQRVKIHIRPGLYREKVHIPQNKPYISFIGVEGKASETVITWNDKAGDPVPGGSLGTYNSSSVAVDSDYFAASWITFQNTIIARDGVEGDQAVALRISGDRAVFYRVRFLGWQDTLMDDKGSHYFFQCYIQGSVDFIFGNAKSLYQECSIVAVHGYAIAAHHRSSADEDTGFSFVNCTVSGRGRMYLGRAWGDYSRVVYAHTRINVPVRPIGWDDWSVPSRQRTVMFGEYECRGIGAQRRSRAKWSKALSYDEAKPFLDTSFINGHQWLKF